MNFFSKIVSSTIKDSLFCLLLLFLCFNPYVNLADSLRMSVIFISFVLYLLIPRVLSYKGEEDIFGFLDFSKTENKKDAFVATLSHDLKTPTLSQISSIQMLLSGQFGTLNSEQENILKATLSSCKYMRDMILTLLTTYKFTGGAITLNFEEFNVAELVLECISEAKAMAIEKDINVFVDKDLMATEILCADRMLIKRVIMNLLANAICYALKDTSIKIRLISEKGYFRFYIENHSPFIPDEALKVLFKKYKSFGTRYIKTGIGLGLYLSRKIVEAHRGSIKAESYKDNTNKFGFYIPMFPFYDKKFGTGNAKVSF